MKAEFKAAVLLLVAASMGQLGGFPTLFSRSSATLFRDPSAVHDCHRSGKGI